MNLGGGAKLIATGFEFRVVVHPRKGWNVVKFKSLGVNEFKRGKNAVARTGGELGKFFSPGLGRIRSDSGLFLRKEWSWRTAFGPESHVAINRVGEEWLSGELDPE